MTHPPSPDDRRHPFVRLVAQMTYDHRSSDYSDGDAPVRIAAPGIFPAPVEGMASAGSDGLIDFRPYIYGDNPHHDGRFDGQRDAFGNTASMVVGVEDMPWHIHPDHVAAIRPADDLPPS